MTSSTRKKRLAQFRIVSISNNDISNYVSVIADIGKCVTFTAKHTPQSFLGCPLSELDLVERFKYCDICFLLFESSRCVGYCFGYSAGDCFSQVADVAHSCGWREHQLFEHIPQASPRRSGCVFQVAILPEYHGLGFGRHLVEQATVAALASLPDGAVFAFIPESPRNTVSLNLALRLGYQTQEVFSTKNQNSEITKWREMSFHV